MIIPLFLWRIKPLFCSLQLRTLTKNTKNSNLKWQRIREMKEKMPAARTDPLVLKIDSPEFKSIFTPELQVLKSIFQQNNYEIRMAGGAVRDLLMGIVPTDIDFATTATPDEMKAMLDTAGIRRLNMNGESHGTITARINDTVNYEITTLRIDVVTDGRHADIEFTTDWILDANRRDLTINSMFLDFEGNVYDFFYGYDDLQKRRVVFVGDAATRICEDYLRILRYFRFYGRIANNPDNHEEKTLTAIKNNVKGLERVSGERIWSELQKILDGNYGVELMLKMIQCNLATYIGLPENPDLENFKDVCMRAREKNIKLHPMTMIAALLRNAEDMLSMYKKLRWSNYNREMVSFIIANRSAQYSDSSAMLKAYQYQILTSSNRFTCQQYICELLRYKGDLEFIETIANWSPKFPVSGHVLKEFVKEPKLISKIITTLKGIWIEDNCKSTEKDLLEHVPDIVKNLQEKYKPLLEKVAKKNNK